MLEHVPQDVTLTVTVSPSKGLEHIARARRDARGGTGYAVVPHLSARLVATARTSPSSSRGSTEMGVRDVFVVAGDADEPAGAFEGAAALLDATWHELGHPFEQIGITGYPESHPLIDDETTIAAMFEKARYATLHREPDLLRLARSRSRWVERRLGARHAPADLDRHPGRRAAGEARSASRRGSGSASRSASCASTATS